MSAEESVVKDVPFVDLKIPFCQQILYKTVSDNCGVMWWDIAILIPNIIFLAFLSYGLRVAIRKLQASSSPIFTAFYGLVFAVCLISVLRCIVSMSVNAAVEAGDLTDKLLWLVLRFALLATEMSVVIFGLAFGHLDSKTSIQRVLAVTFTLALLYSTIQGTLELLTEHPEFEAQSGTTVGNETYYTSYDLFAQGGMIFLLTTSIMFFMIYFAILLLPFTRFRERFQLPTKKAFYQYSGFLAVLNLAQAVAAVLVYEHVENGLCVIDLTTYVYFCFYNPLVYMVFLWNFFRTSGMAVQFSYKHHLGEEENSSSGLGSPGGGGGLEDDQLSLPVASSSNASYYSSGGTTATGLKRVGADGFVDVVSGRRRRNDHSTSELSPFYSIDSTHLDFSPTEECGGSASPDRFQVNADLYRQVAVSPPV